MKERDISRYLNKRVKELGGEIRRVTWQGRRNAPDKLVLLPGWAFFVEEKRPGESPTPAQLRERDRLQACGLSAYWVSRPEHIDCVLDYYRDTAKEHRT